MNTEPASTETVVRHHLQAFLEQESVASIVSDYDDDACFLTEVETYRGRQEIHGFFSGFIASLPASAIDRFILRSLRVDGNPSSRRRSRRRDVRRYRRQPHPGRDER